MIRVIAGTARNIKLEVPVRGTKPVTDRIKTVVFDLLREFIQDATVLDLFAGSGAYGIEALSRGAKSCTFVDGAEEATQIITENLEKTKLTDQAKVVTAKLPRHLTELKEDAQSEFDLVFCDPPFTRMNKFDLEDYTNLITENNLFILRVPKDWQGKIDVNMAYEETIGVSRVLFLRK